MLRRAMTVAADSPHPKWFMGAIVVRGSRVVSTAYNVRKNSPALMDGAPGTSEHAEAAAIRKLTYQADRAEGATLYVARVSKTGAPRLARPCSACWHKILAAGVRNICYTLSDGGYAIEMMTSPLYTPLDLRHK